MNEMFDVLDENGIPTGEVVSRDEVHKRGLWHECVHICIINSKNEILLQRRSCEKEKYPDLWDISVAGHLTTGAFAMDALFLEIMEEVGVIVPKGVKIDELRHLKTYRVIEHIRDDYIDKEFRNLFIAHIDEKKHNIVLQFSVYYN